ncbi:MAG: alkaline phosphatase D family protein [Deltaproteobacteria bacterium]|jgi:alkaline phosphatase D|nr:alkaline phosphatase D family protein [Deltaproteobacteria bacterium]
MAMQRREFLRATLASVGGFSVACGSGEPRAAVPAPELFPQSVASGDPQPDAVILWTRVETGDDGDVEVELELYRDVELRQRAQWDRAPRVLATLDHDHCVKVRAAGLEADTVYYYRFVAEVDGELKASQIGRTRTAPAVDADRPVRFAFVACQDYGGRYYNGYAHLAQQPELDFFVHLGDYIYETAGDAGFQQGSEGREVVFEDTAGVLSVDRTGDGGFEAARSLDNYRQLYRLFRSDAALQRVHEQLPMLAIWDDHEFSDDCWGATATYQDGRVDETDVQRRSNANLAWFEYMPVDYAGDPSFEYDPAVAPPDDIRIWRDFRFGRHVHLVLTDLRSRRSDHLVPEDAYPGAVVLTQAQLEGSGGVPDDAGAYVEDIATFAGGIYRDALVQAADAAGYPSDRVSGAIAASWINDVVAELGAPAAIDEAMLATLPLGYAWANLMKGSLWSRIGSRYLVARDAFARLAAVRWQDSGGASEQAMGDAQEQWFLDTMQGSDATWKVWGNEFCLMPLQIDLRLLSVPPSFQRVFHINVDDWNGMGNRRDALLRVLSDVPGVVAITGDIHAFFAGTPAVRDDPSRSVLEFVTSSISSTTFQRLLQNQVEDDPVLSMVSGASQLAGAIRDLLQLTDGPNPHLAHADVTSHGYAVVEADGLALQVTFHAHAEDVVAVQHYDDPGLDGLFATTQFRVDAGTKFLQQRFGDTWKRWDPTTQTWIA